MAEKGEHPEWHGYEMTNDSCTGQVIGALYKAGCLRVGSTGDRMHFEGTATTIQNLHQKAKDLAEGHGMTAEFEPRAIKN